MGKFDNLKGLGGDLINPALGLTGIGLLTAPDVYDLAAEKPMNAKLKAGLNVAGLGLIGKGYYKEIKDVMKKRFPAKTSSLTLAYEAGVKEAWDKVAIPYPNWINKIVDPTARAAKIQEFIRRSTGQAIRPTPGVNIKMPPPVAEQGIAGIKHNTGLRSNTEILNTAGKRYSGVQ